MSPSYGYTYLTSYGWAGMGTGLRNGAIAKPLAIPPKKNLCGLGKDRDEAFPFWDHLFATASKAITIKISGDDGSEDEDHSLHPDPASGPPLRRTTTGILSNRRPISSTPASTSGSTTPSLPTNTDTEADADASTAGRLSLLASAKREAAKCGLYAQFFRGPVLGLDQHPDPCGDSSATAHSVPPCSESAHVAEQVGSRQEDAVGEGVTRKSGRKRKSDDTAETKEERRERKRLKRERRTARAAKKTAKEKALVGKKIKEKKDRRDPT